MAQELSSNWKKLQAKIKAESSAPASSSKPAATKRKAEATGSGAAVSSHQKRQRLDKQPAARPLKDSKKKAPLPPQQSNSKLGAALPKAKGKAQAQQHMGVTQSSAVTRGTPATITPSLALWAEDNDISLEDLAEAYNLGAKNNASLVAQTRGAPSTSTTAKAAAVVVKATAAADGDDRARENEGLAPPDVIASLGRYVAIDCEMVGVGPEGRESALARVSLVDFHGRQVYDSLVRPRERVTDWRTAITGLEPRHMRPGGGARDFSEAQRAVTDLLRGRVLVGHDVRHDLAALELLGLHPAAQVRDTARHAGYRAYGHGPKPALRVLAREVLGVEIQAGRHSSLEDARVAMLLFRRRKPEFDVEHATKYGKMIARRGGGGEEGGDEAVGGGGGGAGKDTKAKAKKKKKKKH